MWNRKWDLIGAGVFALVLLLILMFAPRAVSNEINQTNQLNDWFEKQYDEMIEFQRESWKQAGLQLELNKQQIQNMPETISLSVSQSFNDISNLFTKMMDGLNITVSNNAEEKKE